MLFVGGAKEVTTTDTLTTVLEIDSKDCDEITIMIKNKGDTNSAYVEVCTKVLPNGEIEYKEYSGTLGPGDVIKVILNGLYGKVIVKAKSTEADASTILKIEWCGRR